MADNVAKRCRSDCVSAMVRQSPSASLQSLASAQFWEPGSKASTRGQGKNSTLVQACVKLRSTQGLLI